MCDDVSAVFVVLGNDMTCYMWCCVMTQDWYVIMCNDVCAKQNFVVITFSATHSTAVCNGLKHILPCCLPVRLRSYVH